MSQRTISFFNSRICRLGWRKKAHANPADGIHPHALMFHRSAQRCVRAPIITQLWMRTQHFRRDMVEPLPLRVETISTVSKKRTVFVAWAGARLDGFAGRIGIPMQLAECINIEEGIVVRVIPLPGTPTA
eukprot:24203-Amorphochlora_amoeboformis.AAC.1